MTKISLVLELLICGHPEVQDHTPQAGFILWRSAESGAFYSEAIAYSIDGRSVSPHYSL